MTIKIGVILDPLDSLKVAKDSSIAMMRAAQESGWQVHTMLQSSLYVRSDRDGSTACADTRIINLTDTANDWYQTVSEQTIDLAELDVILMRKDPPFDMEYINTTYMLDLAQQAGSLIVNNPSALRDANEKMFITQFPQCCTPMCITRDQTLLRQFIDEHKDVILKPLDGMGGAEIFRLRPDDANLSVVLESITRSGNKTVMAQEFISDIVQGDKRILLIDGEPVPYALARIPAEGETRGNLAAGGRGEGVPLNERDVWICQQIAPVLKQKGILFAGIDVIGEYLTEINITSPTCIRELDDIYGLDIAGDLMAAIFDRIKSRTR